MSTSNVTVVPLANYSTGLARFDTKIVSPPNGVIVESGDISFNAGYVVNTTAFTLPNAISGNGFSFSGWFLPVQSVAQTLLYLDMSGSAGPITVSTTDGGPTATRRFLSATYNGTTLTTTDASHAVAVGAWNFFCLMVECSGNTAAAAMSLHVNGGLYTATATGNYVSKTCNSTYLGATRSGTNQFVGKMDDIRSFMRVLRPMEISVLYMYATARNGGLTLTPRVSLTTTTQYNDIGTITGAKFTLDPSSVFSYVAIQRSPAFSSGNSVQYVSASAIQHVSGEWVWSDGPFAPAYYVPLTYSVVPYALGAPASTGTQIVIRPNVSTPFIVESISPGLGMRDTSGMVFTNGILYKVLWFGLGSSSYTITYTAPTPSYLFMLVVGAGGGGTKWAGGGGGGGGVVMKPVWVPAGSGTMTLRVSGPGYTGPNSPAGSTTVTFSDSQIPNITAWGGGSSSNGDTPNANYAGGSGGGNAVANPGGACNNIGNSYGNPGGSSYRSGSLALLAGGGGAGTVGRTPNASAYNTSGGDGIKCYLPGIRDISGIGVYGPVALGPIYWGGGGGGSFTGGDFSTSPVISQGAGGGGGVPSGRATDGYYLSTGWGGGGAAGGDWGYAGNGSSGAIAIAIPVLSAITNVKETVAPLAGNDVLSQLSSAGYAALKGAFACRLLNYNYFGPVMTLRASTDAYGHRTANFYADVCGNLGTDYLGTGTSLVAWLTAQGADTRYAYVTKWYNQGMDTSFNSATQYITTSQPIYDVSFGMINFGYRDTGGGTTAGANPNAYLILNDGALPYADSPYTYVLKHGNVTGTTYNTIVSGGSRTSASMAFSLSCNTANSGSGYSESWYNNGNLVVGNIVAANNVITAKYLGGGSANAVWLYVNNTGVSLDSNTGVRNQQTINNTIGGNAATNTSRFNGQLYYLYVTKSALSDDDRHVLEAT